MFDHLSIGVSDLDRSLAFYDAALKPLGISRMFALKDRQIAAYSGSGGVTFWLYAQDSNSNPLKNLENPQRFHLAFKAVNHEAVDKFYAQAIANQGKDEGAPGIRTQYHPKYYAAYVFDPDGYKLEAVCHT